ncbi:Maltase B1 [Carabus blaptoides fortunei]
MAVVDGTVGCGGFEYTQCVLRTSYKKRKKRTLENEIMEDIRLGNFWILLEYPFQQHPSNNLNLSEEEILIELSTDTTLEIKFNENNNNLSNSEEYPTLSEKAIKLLLPSYPDAVPREKRQMVSSDNNERSPLFLIVRREELFYFALMCCHLYIKDVQFIYPTSHIMMCYALLIFACATALVAPAVIGEWWKTAVFYQIYPRSFKDSDNDGSGDLKGITQKLEYIKETGITAIWLSPIYSSPMVDAGYDISNFREINTIFGNMNDFDELLEKAKNLGLKVILDFVPNHSSDQHEWFQKSVKREGKYTDYYVWHDGKLLENGTRVPPNNWQSAFIGSAWSWNEERQQYYLHIFAEKQPDLNYRSPYLVEEMKDVHRFWLDKGVSGFRVDAISGLFEDTRFLDEPKKDPSIPDDQLTFESLDHIYTQDLNETYDMVYQWRALLDKYTENDGDVRVMMTESYTTIEKNMRFYGNATHDGAHFPFNFDLITDLTINSTADDYVSVINKWLNHMPTNNTANWVLGNHDRHRVATRLESKRVDGLAMMAMMLPGVGITYNGEEIGMEDGFVSWEQTQDPNALNAGKEHYLEYTRDPERTPYHWDDSVNSGFNEGAPTWLPVSDKYKQNNLKAQQKLENSHYKIYQELMKLRQTDVIKEGSYSIEAINGVFVLIRSYHGLNYVLLFNVGATESTVNLDTLNDIPDNLTVKINSLGAQNKREAILNKNKLQLKGYEALILEAA